MQIERLLRLLRSTQDAEIALTAANAEMGVEPPHTLHSAQLLLQARRKMFQALADRCAKNEVHSPFCSSKIDA